MILTGFKIYFSLLIVLSLGDGDEKKDHSSVVNHDGNTPIGHSFSSGGKGHFSISTRMSSL
jgi:hypothetical protein